MDKSKDVKAGQERAKRTLVKTLKIVVTVVVVAVLATVVFVLVRLDIKGREILREAKNAKLALRTTEIEYYGEGKSIYSPESINGLSQGVKESVEKLMPSVDGDISLLSYDKKKKEITGLLYSKGRYRVYYYDTGKETEWTVYYMWRLMDFKEEKK
ncbi:MAG: hypothetical protein IIY49_01165 [Eubacterium sp.]|nr:hypothetical protein [Eubacterium sp.]